MGWIKNTNQFLRVILSAALTATLLPLGLGIQTENAYAGTVGDEMIYALLYEDNSLVLQAEAASKNNKSLKKVYSISGRQTLSGVLGEAGRAVKRIDIAEPIRPKNLECYFAGMNHVEEITNLRNLDPSAAKVLYYTFGDIWDLKSIDLEGFDTSEVTNMEEMFENCKSLERIDLSPLNTSNVSNFSAVFSGCISLASIDLSGLNLSNVVNMHYAFGCCEALSTINFDNIRPPKEADLSALFYECSSLLEVDLSPFFDTVYPTTKITNASGMFGACSSLEELNLSEITLSYAVNMSSMFSGCRALQMLDCSSVDTSAAENMDFMFAGCSSLGELDLSSFDTSSVSSMTGMFSGCDSLRSVDLSSFDVSNVRSFEEMFYGCRRLESLDLTSFECSPATNLRLMFSDCQKLRSVNLSSFALPKGSNFQRMFSGCTSLEVLDLSSLGSEAVADANGMFESCTSLKFIDLSGINFKRNATINGMFSSCSSLTALDLSCLEGVKVLDAVSLLSSCCSLTTLKTGGSMLGNYGNFISDGLFGGEMNSLSALDVSAFDTSSCQNESQSILPSCVVRLVTGPKSETKKLFTLPEDSQWQSEDGVVYSAEDLPQHSNASYTRVNNRNNKWVIMPQVSSHIYDGTDKKGVIGGENCSVLGTAAASETGLYEVTIVPEEGAEIAKSLSGLSEPVSLQWAIYPAQAQIDVSEKVVNLSVDDKSAELSVEYTGDGKLSCLVADPSVASASFIDGKLIIDPLKAGTTSVLLSVPATKNYNEAKKRLKVVVVDPGELQVVEEPRVVLGLEYSGENQIGVAGSEGVNVVGGEAVDAGNYTAIATPMDGYCWEGGSTCSIPLKWSIAKAQSSFKPLWAEVSLKVNETPRQLVFGYVGDGSLSISTNDPTIAVAAYQNDRLVITPKGIGETEVVAQISDGRNYLGFSHTIQVLVVDEAIDPPGTSVPGEPGVSVKPVSPGADASGQKPTPKPLDPAPSVPAALSIAKGKAVIGSKTYTGKKLKPSSIVVRLNGKLLKSGVDYTVSCSGGKKVGNYAVTIQGKGRYCGAISGQFQIVPKAPTAGKIKAARKSLTVTWKKLPSKHLKQVSGYQVRWSTSKGFTAKTTKTKLVKGSKKTSLKISKLKRGKKYYVQIRSYTKTGGKTIYSSWSKAKSTKVK